MPFNIDYTPSTTSQHWKTPRCNICGLYKTCKSPKIKVGGFGKKKILIVGEAPGKYEDEQGEFFVGKSGTLLKEILLENNIKMRRDCWLYNSLICRPPNNRTPTSEEISYCRPNLNKLVKELQPNVILTVGHPALESITTGIWKEKLGPIGKWVGWKIPSVDYNAWIVPTYHPSYVLREKDAKAGSPIRTIFSNHISQISKITRKPFLEIPNYEKQIELILDPKEAAKILYEFIKKGGPISFDYETECLKPDKGGRIYSAAVCWRGKRTIAFPWYSQELMIAWSKLMASDCPKIGHNSKFEDRWTRRQEIPHMEGEKTKLTNRMKVNNWIWCTMVGTHIADNRRGICSLGMQTFVQLGVGDYSSRISKFLSQKHSYHKNKIREINLNKLLVYNGLDALFTYMIAIKQMKQLKMELI